MIEGQKHPDWNDLARLADLGPAGVDRPVLEHLAVCGECQSAWAEATRYRGARLLSGDGYAIPEDLALRARAFVGAAVNDKQAAPHTVPTPRRGWLPRPAYSLGGALLAAVLALFILFPVWRGTDPASDSHRLIKTILASQSEHGMIYPGVTGAGDTGQPVYRSADGADSSLQAALDQMHNSWQQGSQTPDDAWWLAAGYVAAGRLGLASDLVHQALRRHPDHMRLLYLEAITAWQMSEFERAEHSLQRILILAPTETTAQFNLALLQIETGRGAEATAALKELVNHSGDTLLRQRAQDILDRNQQP